MKSNQPMLSRDGEEIIVIEYEGRRPCAVVTRKQWEHSGQRGVSKAWYDFDWSRYFGSLFQHWSGGGPYEPGFYLGKLIGGTHEIWHAPGIILMKTVRLKTGKPEVEWAHKRASAADVHNLGYRIIKHPRLLTSPFGEKSRNPFELAEEGQTIYCKRCDDYLPDDDVTACGHLKFCDDCGEHVDLKSRERLFALSSENKCR
ncbi:MAG: hypothetical protein ABI977_12995 [Acidobacteriota bacterium]